MKVIAFNGSPRKSWNTATLLGKALEGAASRGAETELVQLYDLHFTGCKSCFGCKMKNGPSYGKCAARDDLTPYLAKAAQADAILLGTPIYLSSITGEMKSCIERLVYPYLVYDAAHSSLFPRKIKVGFICTMGANEQNLKERTWGQFLQASTEFLQRIFGSCETLYSCDTTHTDYEKIVSPSFDVAHKEQVRRERFPLDCDKAYQLGARMAAA